MKITCAGGASSIGASCILFETESSSLIIDCGTRPGERKSPLPDLSILVGKNPSAIIITHAHTDHSGALPVLVEYFPGVPILATAPTIDLVGILLRDSLKIMNSPEREGDIPLYNEKQVERVFENFVPLRFNEPRIIGDMTVNLYQAGHIIGAAMVHVATIDGNILISGDYCISAQRTVGSACRPALPVDLLISESTYGERLHEDRSVAETRFIEQVKQIINREGKILVPSFAIGRAQEIILILRKAIRDGRLDRIPVYVDGMVRAVCNIYSGYENYVTRSLSHEIYSNRHPFYNESIIAVETETQRSKILQGDPCLIVASSGMLNGGASVFYAREILKNDKNAVLFTGYQDEESPGRALLNLSESQAETRTITLSGEEITVKALVQSFGLSAHADRMEMAGFIDSMKPRTVLLVHGSNEARDHLKQSIRCKDCISGFDGLILERNFSTKQSTESDEEQILPEEKDVDRIRSILGPPSHIPVKGSSIADMWYGTRVKAHHIERLVNRLIDLDLVRRDDEKSRMLWVLPPSQSKLLQYEAAVIERVKKENPKGMLLEYCMKMNIEFPVTTWGIDGGFHTAGVVLKVNGIIYESRIHRAAERIVAEQLASEEVLVKCTSDENVAIGNSSLVSDDDADMFKASNPKGALLEYCMKQHLPTPFFEFHVISGDWCCRVIVENNYGKQISSWYRSKAKITAQHGAAAEVMKIFGHHINARQEKTNENLAPIEVENSEGKPPENSGTDPRVTLNILKQRGYILDFGYTKLENSGPSHAPVFSVKSWVKLPDQTMIESSVKTGSSRREAERNAAKDIVDYVSSL